ncbi:GtrA family protein [Haliscomenobacter sp.]|jgi:putative flippase GtrA|uniref:GtrA family protein n=1 Tax=Haliscomenobacter sp. TaxID=2717303 RepID=UPI003364CFF8
MALVDQLKTLLGLKLKYAASAGIATAVDYAVFFSLTKYLAFAPVQAQPPAYAVGVLINFLIARRYVFDLNRSVWSAFRWSVLVSLGGLTISTGLIYLFDHEVPFLQDKTLLAKILTSGIVFFYNFYLKRLVFEGKFV